ncbi:MAG: hypothetical protein ACNI3H_02585 [Halarcobacter ebronensis]
MELNSYSQSASSIYQQLAQKRSELANIDKKELKKLLQMIMTQLMLLMKSLINKTMIEF